MSECSLAFCNRQAAVVAKNAGVKVCKSHYQQDYNGRPFTPLRDYLDLRMDDNGRVCTKCFVYKPWSDYYAHSDGRNRRAICKPCAIKAILTRTQKRIASASPCSVNDCTTPAYLIGLCKTHYGRDYQERNTTK